MRYYLIFPIALSVEKLALIQSILHELYANEYDVMG